MSFYIMTWREEDDDYPFLGYYPDINTLMFDLTELYFEFDGVSGPHPAQVKKKVLENKGDVTKTEWVLDNSKSVFITIKKCTV
jgi:hypothetical protein